MVDANNSILDWRVAPLSRHDCDLYAASASGDYLIRLHRGGAILATPSGKRTEHESLEAAKLAALCAK